MAEIFFRRDFITQQLFDFFRFWKAVLLFARKQCLAVYADFKDAACAWNQRDFAQFLLEGGEEFLRQPGGAQQPAALRAVFDFNAGFGGHIATMEVACRSDQA